MKAVRIVIVGMALILGGVGSAEAQRAGAPVVRADRFTWEGGGPHIGASARDFEPADAERARSGGGAVLESVQPDGPAARAGMQAADIVTEFDGERVRSARHFARLVRETRPDLSVKATVVRGGRKIEMSVTPTEAPGPAAFISGRMKREMENLADRLSRNDVYAGPFFAGRARLGASVQELTPQLASYFGAQDGVLVESVTDGSPAARAGLRAGDVITAVNSTKVGSRSELVRALAAEKGTVTIAIVRDKKPSTLSATLEEPRPARPLRPIRTDGGTNL
jgi:S1-C subfamily serine protease